ncbi:MAG: hypothetical protein D6798_13315, partial [Deltaproteobacteria bacterium]
MTPALLIALLAAGPAHADDAPLTRAWILYGAWPGADYGAALSTAGDVDGDGHPDLAVGAPFDDVDGEARGRVVVYLARPAGAGYAGESWMATGAVDHGHYGGALAGGGDLDGDGFDDLVVASTYQDRRVDVYVGSAAGLSEKPAWTATASGGRFGWAVALLPPADGEAYAALAIGDAAAGDGGQVHLYPGGPGGPADEATLLLGDDDHPVGAVLDPAGDVDGDGLPDLLCAPGAESATGAGAIFAGQGGGELSPVPSYHLARPADASGFGVSASGAGDLDGDGYDEVVIGADGLGGPETAGRGMALVWRGAATGPGGQPDQVLSDDTDDSMFGSAVEGAGDVDGDGFDDLVVGRPAWSGDYPHEGGIVLFLGSADGPLPEPAWTAGSGVSADDRGGSWIGLGLALAAAGDVDLDGYADLAVGVSNVGGESYDERLG